MTLLTEDRVSLGCLHMGGICPLHMGGTSAGGQSINGGTHEEDLTLIDYIINYKYCYC